MMGKDSFFDSDTEHTYSVTLNKKLVPTSTIRTNVQTIKLDTFIEKNNITSDDLIKIDVETHEAEVLSGVKSSLIKFKPTILVEILYKETGQNIETIFKDIDYLFFHIDENNGAKQVQSLNPSHPNYNFLLCDKKVAETLELIPKIK